jgi:hypothetical protein
MLEDPANDDGLSTNAVVGSAGSLSSRVLKKMVFSTLL